jgi:hypothetical protein
MSPEMHDATRFNPNPSVKLQLQTALHLDVISQVLAALAGTVRSSSDTLVTGFVPHSERFEMSVRCRKQRIYGFTNWHPSGPSERRWRHSTTKFTLRICVRLPPDSLACIFSRYSPGGMFSTGSFSATGITVLPF